MSGGACVLGRARRSIGSDLLIQMGEPEEVIPGLGASQVLAQAGVCSEETSVEQKLKRRLGSEASLSLIWGKRDARHLWRCAARHKRAGSWARLSRVYQYRNVQLFIAEPLDVLVSWLLVACSALCGVSRFDAVPPGRSSSARGEDSRRVHALPQHRREQDADSSHDADAKEGLSVVDWSIFLPAGHRRSPCVHPSLLLLDRRGPS